MACAVVCLAASTAQGWVDPLFSLSSVEDWSQALEDGRVRPLSAQSWLEYMGQWENNFVEGDPYTENSFSEATLYVHGGDEEYGAGLVMVWEPDAASSETSWSSAWEYVHPQDPDLSNCTITLTITAPQFDLNGNQITTVSFGMKDAGGNIRSWNWSCGPATSTAPIKWNVPTTVNINTAATGVGASIPMASGYMSPAAFDITQVLTLIVDENATWIGPGIAVPPPGTLLQRPWNLWADLLITKNPSNPIVVGVNIDVHQDIDDPTGGQAPVPNDFHIEGRIESGLPDGTWSNPPVLITHVDGDGLYIFPNFTHSITPDTTDPSGNWYIVTADWSGIDIPYCTVIHLGLEFEVTCHNIIIDLVGWWTIDGQPVGAGANGGFVPIAGFEVQDNVGLPPDQQGPQKIRLVNGDQDGQQEPGEIPTEIVQMDLTGMSRADLVEHLGPDYFKELRGNGLQESLPWVQVENVNGPISQTNPQNFHIDSFFDVFFDITVPPRPTNDNEGRAMGPVQLGPGDFLIARQLVRFIGNDGTEELRWFFEIHEAHNESTHDLGDAPDSSNHSGAAGVMTAYPDGTGANYPTVYDGAGVAGSPPHGPIHWQPTLVAHLGPAVTGEIEADLPPDMDPTTNIIPPTDTPDKDVADDGVLGLPFTLTSCNPMRFQYLVNVITPNTDMYVNVWFDWNRDGDWDDTFNCPIATANVMAPEWAVKNQLLSGLPIGLNTITSPGFRPYLSSDKNEDDPIWMRITLTGIPVQDWSPADTPGLPGYGGSGPANGYDIDETEDYYFTPKKTCFKDADLDCSKFVDLADLAIFASQHLSTIP